MGERLGRTSWDEYFMNMAHLAATRSTCDRGVPVKYISGRKAVGAVIVKDRTVLSTGYNGSPRGFDHCDEAGHEIVDGHCVRTVHAEANAIAAAAKNGIAVEGATIYTTASPCYDCFKMLINSGIKRIVCGSFYGSRYGASDKVLTLAAQVGIIINFLKSEADADHNLDEDTMRLDLSSPLREIKIKKVHPSAVMPELSRKGDAGYDIVAVEGASIAPGQRASLPTGLAFEIPEGFVGLIWDRSGLSHKKGLKIMGGVIDSSFRGEVKIGLLNTSSEPIEIMKGDKIAQMIIQKFETVDFKISEELTETDRGEKWLGSSDEPKDVKVDEIKEIKKDQNDQRPKSTSRW